jgi:putative transposase
MWNLPAPPGFQGLRDDLPFRCYSRHMPPWRQPGATYFVTFRLADSLPQAKLRELRQLKLDGFASLPQTSRNLRTAPGGRRPERNIDLKDQERIEHEAAKLVEQWLDQGMGSCVLRDAASSQVVVDAMMHFDEERYELGCYVVMPNHAHAIVRPFDDEKMPLEKILQSWKGWVSRHIRTEQLEGRAFWQAESFDRILRDEEHLFRAIQYIGSNPQRANLSADECRRWIRSEWERLGWGFAEAASS